MTKAGPSPLDALREAVQFNCDVSDARHAADFSMCVYLLKMREYYRWERGLGLNAALSQDEVGDWLRRREDHWAGLTEAEFKPLPVGHANLDPFDAPAANDMLLEQGYVYSAGYGHNANPHFVLARLRQHERLDDFEVFHCAEELARDLSAPPAMAQGRTIYLRGESIRRMIWEKIQESDWHSEHSAMHQALRHYRYADAPEPALDRMCAEIGRIVLDHEIGELHAGAELSPDWEQMVLDLHGSRAEIALRAMRDLYADVLVTLPRLIAAATPGMLHFYASNMTAMRRHLFPAFVQAYQAWQSGEDRGPLSELLPRARKHWAESCAIALQAWRDQGADARADIEQLIEDRRL